MGWNGCVFNEWCVVSLDTVTFLSYILSKDAGRMRCARGDVKKMTDNHHLANKWTISSWFLSLLSKNSSEVSAFQKNWHNSVWMAKSYRKCTKSSPTLLISSVHFQMKYIVINFCHDIIFIFIMIYYVV